MAEWRQELKFDTVSSYFVHIIQLPICLGGKRLLFLLQTIHSERFGASDVQKTLFSGVKQRRRGSGTGAMVNSAGEFSGQYTQKCWQWMLPLVISLPLFTRESSCSQVEAPYLWECLMWFFPSFQVLEFELTPEDMKAIDGLNRNFRFFKLPL